MRAWRWFKLVNWRRRCAPVCWHLFFFTVGRRTVGNALHIAGPNSRAALGFLQQAVRQAVADSRNAVAVTSSASRQRQTQLHPRFFATRARTTESLGGRDICKVCFTTKAATFSNLHANNFCAYRAEPWLSPSTMVQAASGDGASADFRRCA